MTTALEAPPSPPSVPTAPAAGVADEIFTIEGLRWDQYVAINDALGDRTVPRVLFCAGRLTMVSPGFLHEWSEDTLDAIVKAVAVAARVRLTPIGSTTLRKVGVGAGIEGDRVYYLGANVARLRGITAVDLNALPPPDLAIEVENTHRATDALTIYAQLGVPEVWRRDVRRESLTFNRLQADGTYVAVARSSHFPFLAPDDLLPIIQQADTIHCYTDWAEILADWVRDVIRPRLDCP